MFPAVMPTPNTNSATGTARSPSPITPGTISPM